MNDKGMLPLPLAFEIEREIYDFLNVSFEIKATKSGEALKKYYTQTSPLIKGPFVKISLPYEASKNSDESPLSLKMKYPPYRHQLNAFKRLVYTNAQNSIVTTGTGSGKTECFLYPILDYVRELKKSGKGEKGIKAIIIYPTNALLDDQGLRFVKTIKEQNLESLDIKVGKYTGGNGRNRSMNYKENKVIDHKETLIVDPPDIILTNYKMLDYMLFRDQEKPLWNEQTREFLKYLVLDEMHTFDGAQGSDVACLIRRLKAVSGSQDKLVYVGTSATLSSSINAKKDLCSFAGTLFGSTFLEDSIIVETKHTSESYLGAGTLTYDEIPSLFSENPKSLDYKYGETIEEYVSSILKVFGKEDLLYRRSEIGSFLKDFDVFSSLVRIGADGVISFDQLCHRVGNENPQYLSLGEDGFKILIKSFLTLASFARHDKIADFPFLTVKISLWTSELKQTLSKVVGQDEEWEFVEENDVINSQDLYLPSVYCSHCGESGWATYYTENEDTTIKSLISKPHTIRSQYALGKGSILFPFNEKLKDLDEVHYLYKNQRKLQSVDEGDIEDEKAIPVIKVQVKEGRCPACDSKLQVRFFSLGSSSLSTVIANSCFSHPLNQDRKLLSFSDSVQDASHQASFINNRSFSFSFKKFLASKITVGMTLSKAQKNILSLDNLKKLDRNSKLDAIGKFAPDKLRKKWAMNGFQDDKEPSPEMIKSLCEVVEYNTFGEFTFKSRFGWSFEKVGHSGFFISESKWKEILESPRNIWIERDQDLNIFNNNKNFEQFLYGFLQRLKAGGVVYTSFLDMYYSDTKADYYVAYKFHDDLPLMEMLTKPKFFTPTIDFDKGRKQNFETLGSKNSWYWRWVNKFSSTVRVNQFYEDFSIWLESTGLLKQVGKKDEGKFVGKPRYVLNPEHLVYQVGLEHYECSKCKTRYTAPPCFNRVVVNSPCSQRFCNGEVLKHETIYASTYFQRYFSKEALRINASEHTGSFDSDLKEKVEDEFKKTRTLTPNYDTNYLSCTPTMEMGIDIGDLSSVILKSVPRNAASYFQRIGRSGRTTGNSLDFLVIDKKPHNMYFWAEPSELLNWEVVTPACRYKTGHILQRQYNAYVMDQFLHTSEDKNTVLPNSFQWLEENNSKKQNYWDDLFDFEKENRAKLFDKFCDYFDLKSDKVGQELKEFIEKNGVRNSFQNVFDKIKNELVSLDEIILNYKSEISKLNPKDEDFYQKIEKAQTDKDAKSLDDLLENFDEITKNTIIEICGSIIAARKKRAAILNPQITYLLSKLSDSAVLPGYAFPEEGCELEFNIKKPISKKKLNIKEQFHTISIIRSPEAALTDLAPYNHFYTHGYEAVIDRLGIYGKKNSFKKLGTCVDCGHVTSSNLCEVCNIPIEQSMYYDFKMAKATSAFEKSYVNDSKEGREKERFEITRSFLFDALVSDSNRKIVTFYNEETQFGYEFQSNIEIYTINQGFKASNDKTNTFAVCKNCGAVENPKNRFKGKGEAPSNVNHYKSCSAKDVDLEKVSLFRKIQSDAVRIPVLNSHLIPMMKTVLKRAVEIHLKGDTGHISISDYTQDAFEGNTFVVVFDNVPGGTGHLRDLFGISLDQEVENISPKQFLKMFSDVLDHINKCKCDNGCYHCVWSSENIKDKERVTKKGTIFYLQRLISQSVSDFKRKDAGLLEIVKEHSFDGHTEAMLFHGLNALGPKIPFKEYQFTLESIASDSGSSLWKVKFENSYCYLKSSPFESLELKGIGATKPDFHVLDKDQKIVGFIYSDGSRFHLNPGQEVSTFDQDIILRNSLSKQFDLPVLTFTYKELDDLNTMIFSDDEILRTKDLYQFSSDIFEIDPTSLGQCLKKSQRNHLTISLLLRIFNIAAGNATELKEKELGESYLQWATSYSSDFMKFNLDSRTLEVNTNIKHRSDQNSYTKIDTIPEAYYLTWVSFWQIFNVASMANLLRKKFKYKSIS